MNIQHIQKLKKFLANELSVEDLKLINVESIAQHMQHEKKFLVNEVNEEKEATI